jgi:glycosyltransferase involved in cell wall biosynthesis
MKIALVTPLKNERENIERFLSVLSKQSIEIFSVIILENDSDDGSKEYLEPILTVPNIKHFTVINLEFEDKSYRVDAKYSSIVQKGFEYLEQQEYFNDLDFIGILDSDCFPEENYYEELTAFMNSDNKLGISSGLIFTDAGKLHKTNINWVRGGCRLWKIDCFKSAGFLVEPSPDVISVALAHIHGWTTRPCKRIKVISREVGENGDYSFYGASAHYRGHTIIYIIIRSLYYTLYKLDLVRAIQYLRGYLSSIMNNNKKLSNKKLRTYYNWYLFNKLIKKHH